MSKIKFSWKHQQKRINLALSRVLSTVIRQKLFFILLLLATPIFIFVAIKVVSVTTYRDSDFFTFWLSGWMRLVGQDPYSTETWINGHKLFGATWVPNPVFPYPLAVSLLFAPLAIFSLQKAFVIWITFSLIFVMTTIFLLLSNTGNPKKLHLILPLLAGAFLFRPTIVTLTNGQIGAFLLLALGVTVLFWETGRWALGGLILPLLVLKPQLGIPVILSLGLWLIFSRNRSALFAAALSGIFIFAISTVYDSDWISILLHNGGRKLSETLGYSPTFWGVAGVLCRHNPTCTLAVGGGMVAILLLGIGFLLYKYSSVISPMISASLATPVALLVTPYTWAYDQILLILSITAISITVLDRGCSYLLVAVFPILVSLLSLCLLLLATSFGSDVWSAIVPFVCLLSIVYLVVKADIPREKAFLSK